jgi:hypothetical protein
MIRTTRDIYIHVYARLVRSRSRAASSILTLSCQQTASGHPLFLALSTASKATDHYAAEHLSSLPDMSLDRTVSLLKNAAPVVGMVPVIGEQFKSAIEVVTQICEIAQVRSC